MLMHRLRVPEGPRRSGVFPWIIEARRELSQIDVHGGHVHRIWLSFPRTPYSEGDLALSFEVEGLDLYTLSFTIGPGTIAGVAADHAMYIARVQGRGDGSIASGRRPRTARTCRRRRFCSLPPKASRRPSISISWSESAPASRWRRERVIGRPGQSVRRVLGGGGGLPVARQMYRLALPSQEKSIHDQARTPLTDAAQAEIQEGRQRAGARGLPPGDAARAQPGALWLSFGATSWVMAV